MALQMNDIKVGDYVQFTAFGCVKVREVIAELDENTLSLAIPPKLRDPSVPITFSIDIRDYPDIRKLTEEEAFQLKLEE